MVGCVLILIIVYSIFFVIYYTKNLKDVLNIHSTSISLILIYSFPTIILIQRDIIVLSYEVVMKIYFSILLSIIAYFIGSSVAKIIPFTTQAGIITKKINKCFWLTYRYRFILLIIICILSYYKGIMPRGMSYKESVMYRVNTPGYIQYLQGLTSYVFSGLTLLILCIIGDIKKNKKTSKISFAFLVLVILNIFAGHRIWIVGLFACLLFYCQSLFKRKVTLFILFIGFFLVFFFSGAVRYSRQAETTIENIEKMYEYFTTLNQIPIEQLIKKWVSETEPFLTFVKIVEEVPNSVNYEPYAYINDISLMVPKIIYPGERPIPYNTWYVKTFDPQLYDEGGGRTFYVLGFGYLMNGYSGIILHLFLYGFFFELLRNFFIILGTAGSFLYICFFMNLLKFVVSDGFFVFIKTSIFMNLLIPVIVLWMIVFFGDLCIPKRAFFRLSKKNRFFKSTD